MTDLLETFRLVVANAEKHIKELEAYFSTCSLDAYPFVVVLDSALSLSACKALGGNRYNFSAEGRDAVQWSRASAQANADHFTATGRPCKVMSKHEFYTLKLADHRRNRDAFAAHIAKLEAGEPIDLAA